MHENEGLETYQVRKNLINLENPLGKRLGVSERDLGGEKIEVSRERSRDKVSRGVETGVEDFVVDRYRY